MTSASGCPDTFVTFAIYASRRRRRRGGPTDDEQPRSYRNHGMGTSSPGSSAASRDDERGPSFGRRAGGRRYGDPTRGPSSNRAVGLPAPGEIAVGRRVRRRSGRRARESPSGARVHEDSVRGRHQSPVGRRVLSSTHRARSQSRDRHEIQCQEASAPDRTWVPTSSRLDESPETQPAFVTTPSFHSPPRSSRPE